jgi:hypothetical protein
MKKHLFGENRVIYNIQNSRYSPNSFSWISSRRNVIIASLIVLAVGIYFILKGAVFTKPVDFKVTRVDTITQINYDVNYGRSTSTTTTYDLQGTTGGPCGNQVVTMLGYPSMVRVGDTIKAWVKEGCGGLVAEHDVGTSLIIGWVIILIAVGVIMFNLFIRRK